MVSQPQEVYNNIIRHAVRAGYTADVNGTIFAPGGQVKPQRRHPKTGELRVRLAGRYIKIARFTAYHFLGEIALFPGTGISHRNGDPADNRLTNLHIEVIDPHGEERALRDDPAVQTAAATLVEATRAILSMIDPPHLRDAALWRFAEIISNSHIPLSEATTAADLLHGEVQS